MLDRRTVQPVVKLLLVLGGLLVMWGFLSNLPGVERLIPRTPVSLGATIGALLTLGVVAVLVYASAKVRPLVQTTVPGPADLVRDAATILTYAVLFVAVLVAHAGFEPFVEPFLRGPAMGWAYDLFFLVVALVPTVVVAATMYGNLDELSTLITERVVGPDDGDGSDGER